MKRKVHFMLWALCAILAGGLVIPAIGQAKEGDMSEHREWRTKLAKELKLSPDKEAQFAAVADKYANSRKETYEALTKAQGDLKATMSAAKPDEAKVKQGVKVITEAQDKLLTTYKAERDDEMALLTPMQQGQYLEILHKWRMEMYKKHAEEKKGEKK
jgi:Spy/CpxP family protein refolding chaperone